MPEDTNPTSKFAALVSLSLAVVAIVAQRLLHQSTMVFWAGDVFGSTTEDLNKQAAEQIRQFQIYLAMLQRRVHIETIVLTLFLLVLFFILYRRRAIPNWTRYVIVASAAATVAGFFIAW